MHFDGTVSLGSLLTIATLIGIAVRLGWTVGGIQAIITQHSKLLEMHTARMEKQDDMLIRISGDMQRIVGRIESANQQAVIDAASAAITVVKAAEAAALNTVAAAARVAQDHIK